jgi:hypothetical protein
MANPPCAGDRAGSGVPTPFHDLADYMALPRVLALRLSLDGARLVAVVRALAPDRHTAGRYRTALWQLDPGGAGAAPSRLTRSAQGEANPAFLPDGSVLFTSARPDLAAGAPPTATAGGAATGGGTAWVTPGSLET